MITLEQLQDFIVNDKKFFIINKDYSVDGHRATYFTSFTSDVKKPCFGRVWFDTKIHMGSYSYRIEDVFPTKEAAKEEAQRRLVKQLVELNKEEQK